jgi:hypothetical protein
MIDAVPGTDYRSNVTVELTELEFIVHFLHTLKHIFTQVRFAE